MMKTLFHIIRRAPFAMTGVQSEIRFTVYFETSSSTFCVIKVFPGDGDSDMDYMSILILEFKGKEAECFLDRGLMSAFIYGLYLFFQWEGNHASSGGFLPRRQVLKGWHYCVTFHLVRQLCKVGRAGMVSRRAVELDTSGCLMSLISSAVIAASIPLL